VTVPPTLQLGLFAATADEQTSAKVDLEAERLAALLPPHVRLGTSSWTFSGWKGLVYEGDTRMPALTRDGLRAYAKHPLFRTVGIDRSYYAPLTEADLAAYAAALPDGFETVSKVWDEVTTFVFPDHPRYGARAGKKNPRFLDAGLVRKLVLPAYAAAFASHTGPFLLELAPVRSLLRDDQASILVAIERLLSGLPETFSYAFELRTPSLLCARYLDTLRAYRAAHTLSSWTGMPDLATQLRVPGVLTAPFAVARLTLPPGLRYEDAKATLAPFDRIGSPQPAMRRAVVALSRRCAEEGRTLTVLVGNKAEGSAPLTVRALAEEIGASRGP